MEYIPILSDRQKSLMRLMLHNEQGLTLDQLANKLGISRNAVNQHISVLEKVGCIESKTLPSEGGRPSRAFKLNEAGMALFPKQYALFSKMLLKAVTLDLPENKLNSILTLIGRELAEPYKERIAKSDNKIAEVNLIMEELGYETSKTADKSQSSEIVAKNCVFHDLAIENNMVCELDRTLISTLLDVEIEQTECMAKGGESCRFCIK